MRRVVRVEIVKRNSVKEFLRKMKMRTSGGLYEAVNAEVEAMLKRGSVRAEKNGRHTVMGWDV